MKSVQLKIRNERGLHATPACMFAQTAMKFESRIQVAFDDKRIDAKSLILVIALGAKTGDELLVSAVGPDEEAAIEALTNLVHVHNFDGE